jgi:hypothetical protein
MNFGISTGGLRLVFGLLMVAGSLVLLYLLLPYGTFRRSHRGELASPVKIADSLTNKCGPRWKATEENLTTSSGISDTS